jgi:heptosyltransferase I
MVQGRNGPRLSSGIHLRSAVRIRCRLRIGSAFSIRSASGISRSVFRVPRSAFRTSVMPPSRLLIVRLGALGDIVHALPALAALRAAWPEARIDWLVDARHRAVLDLVTGITTRIHVDTTRGWQHWPGVVRRLRRARYDLALDFQGLIKSGLAARLSGAARVAGFARGMLREPAAAWFYTERHAVGAGQHVIRKNLALAAAVGADTGGAIVFPLVVPRTGPRLAVDGPYALLNPGAAWPNKRWPAERFGQLAAWLRREHGLASIVLWGPGEASLATQVASASQGAAHPAPLTTIADVLALAKGAVVAVSGDTGPLHLAAAVGTPLVGLYGPTSPARNGPWCEEDESLSRYDRCVCHHERRCRRLKPCIESITVAEVQDAVGQRLSRLGARTPGPAV